MSGRTFSYQSSWYDIFRVLNPDVPREQLLKAISIAESANQQMEEFLSRYVVTASNDAGSITFDSAGTYTFNGEMIVTGGFHVPDTTTANSFHVDNTGQVWSGATSYSSAKFRVAADGTLQVGVGATTSARVLLDPNYSSGSGPGARILLGDGQIQYNDWNTSGLGDNVLRISGNGPDDFSRAEILCQYDPATNNIGLKLNANPSGSAIGEIALAAYTGASSSSMWLMSQTWFVSINNVEKMRLDSSGYLNLLSATNRLVMAADGASYIEYSDTSDIWKFVMDGGQYATIAKGGMNAATFAASGAITAASLWATTADTTGAMKAQSGGADGGAVIGQTFSTSYVGLRTGGMSPTGSSEYIIMSNGLHTYVSAAVGGGTYIRGGGNSTTGEILVNGSNAILTKPLFTYSSVPAASGTYYRLYINATGEIQKRTTAGA